MLVVIEALKYIGLSIDEWGVVLAEVATGTAIIKVHKSNIWLV
ncbi:hypothetical protein OTSKARP_1549 [Orientia tsutsugamushi str. Karp]|nr:hypothetical protein OTSKARP_1549 [Orientia tsutsugamushi str. Karp]